MKIKHLALAFVAMGAANMAMAASGTITFTGQVVQDTCTVAVNGSGANVVLPTVQASAFSTAGTTAGNTPFTVNVTGCGSAVDTRGIKLTLSSTDFDATNNNLLENTATSGAATNVGIQIDETAVGDIAFAGAPYDTATIAMSSGAGSVALEARYMSTDTTVTPGAVMAAMTWNVVYN
ncbi:fimbrial protein [Acinetobacter sp. VNK23]|uniref:fimbrial protein n=1 Tax=Acinetobacter thutiue TaxID=2998078 RepID=UPI002574FB4E|nr:fimbrial protein [Acinetobacter thutiue]MDM1019188.1 fimbrial protein [Acinetobacter thutiue]